jgi:hypothetical protein
MLGPAAGMPPRLGRASLLLTNEFESLSPVSRTRPAQTRLKYELHREAQLIASATRTKQCAGVAGDATMQAWLDEPAVILCA